MTPLVVDYYLALPSPWAYLGHERFRDIARKHGVSVRLVPFDLGKVFQVSGGLPLARRAPQRQDYRLVELARFSAWLGVPLNLHPRFFPVPADDAARLLIATDLHEGSDAAMKLALAVLAATWSRELDISSTAVLAQLLDECQLPPQRLDDAGLAVVQEQYVRNTEQAVSAGVFGAPTYVIQGELFWGQDRLDFVERRLLQAVKESPG